MTDKAYIVANKEQELDILKKFEGDGIYWNAGEYPTDFIPSEKYDLKYVKFPYALVKNESVYWSSIDTLNESIYWSSIDKLKDTEIVYDGREEEKMYKVTQGFMNELIKWRDEMNLNAKNEDFGAFVNGNDIQDVPDVVYIWWRRIENSIERNNRLIAIIKWLNGEDVFEVEEQHKFVVRNDTYDNEEHYWYVKSNKGMTYTVFYVSQATKFDTREEAKEWANSHQVVVEIDEEGHGIE